MAMNRVQFQSGLSMAQFIQQYGTVVKCYRALSAGVSLSEVRSPTALAVSPRGPDLLPVPRLTPSGHADQRHGVRGQQAVATSPRFE